MRLDDGRAEWARLDGLSKEEAERQTARFQIKAELKKLKGTCYDPNLEKVVEILTFAVEQGVI